jgi:hypothetical protein
MPTVAQKLGAQLDEKRKALGDLYAKHKTTDAERPYNFTKEQVEQVRAMDLELNELHDQWKDAADLERIEASSKSIGEEVGRVARPPFIGGGESNMRGDRKMSLGSMAVKSIYRHDKEGKIEIEDRKPVFVKGTEFRLKDYDPFEYKTTMTTAAGWDPEIVRSGRVVYTALRTPMVADLLPTIRLENTDTYRYMQETTFTNAAAAIAEGGTYPESALAFTPVDAPVTKVGTWIPVTEEQLSDVAGMRGIIDNRLSLMVLLKLDGELLAGDGSSPNIDGFYHQVTQTQAKGSDPVFDAMYKGMTKVRTVGFANVTGVVLHPNDWQDVRLTRTADGIYILGNPDVAGPERMFGVPVVTTTAATENTGLLGDFQMYSALLYRMGLDIQVTDSHDTYFIKDQFAIKARVRAALAIFRLTAFCEVTGI